jgi:hypothetical protein
MTLFAVRLRIADVHELRELQKAFQERQGLKKTFGCTGSRLLIDRENRKSAVVLMEFPTFAAARAYCKTTAFLGTDTLPGMTVTSNEYLEDLDSADSLSPDVS